MRVIVKHGEQTVGGFDCDGPGPDVEIDPWGNLIHTNHRDGEQQHGFPISYHDGLDTLHLGHRVG